MRTIWLSFADETGFLGVAVVEVSAADAATMLTEIDARFPGHAPGAEWIAAASRVAYRHGCNPGGQVLASEVVASIPVPRNRLLQRDELDALGFVAAQLEG